MPCGEAWLLTCTSQVRVQPGHLFISFRTDAVDGGPCFTDDTEKTERGNIIFQMIHVVKEKKMNETRALQENTKARCSLQSSRKPALSTILPYKLALRYVCLLFLIANTQA